MPEMKDKKETKGARTRRQLYECAIQLFREKGYDHVSVDEIVKTAGMAKGTFYIHFHEKSDIIMELLRQYDAYYDQVAASLPADLPAEDKLDELVTGACRFTRNVVGLDLIRVLYTRHLAGEDRNRGLLNEDRALFRILTELIAEGQQSGIYVQILPAKEIAGMILQGIRAAFFEWCSCQGNLDLEKECRKFLKLLRLGIMEK